MKTEKSDLRDFLKRSLSERASEVIDRPSPNSIEGFVIETTGEVSSELLLIMLQRYYPGSQILVRGQSFHWVMRSNKPILLLNITNYSEVGGAVYFGGDRAHGGIGIEITEHGKK